jgi:hypothetical protein
MGAPEMPWGEEQDKLTQEARLTLASPEVVFQELKKLSTGGKRGLFGRDDRLEIVLVKRNHPLINLGLASYGANEKVSAALYKHALEPPKDEADAKYKEGLRIGCLSNTTLAAAHFLRHFPNDIIGPQETWRVLSQGTDAETSALIRNPSIDADLLEALYQRTGVFAQMPEERWCALVSLSRKNERLVTEKHYRDMPHMGLDVHSKCHNSFLLSPKLAFRRYLALLLLDELLRCSRANMRVLCQQQRRRAPSRLLSPRRLATGQSFCQVKLWQP